MSEIHVHELAGCRPTPLAHYLKALGILRLVAEQADASVRGWWRDDAFCIASKLDRDALPLFFLRSYEPTPMVAPWNGGSGFYPKDNKSGIEPIAQSSAPRFVRFREIISKSQQLVSHLNKKPEKGNEKNAVITACRKVWRAGAHEWIDAALALGADGESSFPAMLGTGGNDGRLDFTSNFMQRIASLFEMASSDGKATSQSEVQLSTALWGAATPTLESNAIGQFLPGAAGAPNGSDGFTGSVRVNPWDYVLMLEGAVLFRSGLARRSSCQKLPQAAAPFAVRSSAAGYGSSDTNDAGARGEQWMPIWNQPSTLAEVINIFREGRNQINGKAAQRGTEMARSVARMGVARGISRFERYGYIERNGLSNLAVPLGRFHVAPRPNQDLLDSVASWLDRFRQIAGDKNAPASFIRCHRACEEAVFNCTKTGGGEAFLSLLIAMGRAEDQFVKSPKFAAEKFARPMPRLAADWLVAIQGQVDSVELRLAVALAAQYGKLGKKERSTSVRIHWLPLDGNFFAKGESGLNIGPEQSAIGQDLEKSLISMIYRRQLAVAKAGKETFIPLSRPNRNVGAKLPDIEAFLQHRVDDGRILAIARGLMAVDCNTKSAALSEDHHKPLGGMATYGIIRLAMPTESIRLSGDLKIDVRFNPTIFHRLCSGDVSTAIRLACQSLTACGLRPRVKSAVGSTNHARRLAASMAFGINTSTQARLAIGLTQPGLSKGERKQFESTEDS